MMIMMPPDAIATWPTNYASDGDRCPARDARSWGDEERATGLEQRCEAMSSRAVASVQASLVLVVGHAPDRVSDVLLQCLGTAVGTESMLGLRLFTGTALCVEASRP